MRARRSRRRRSRIRPASSTARSTPTRRSSRLCELADAPKISVAALTGAVAPRRDALTAYATAWQTTGGEAHPWRDADLAAWQLSTGDAVAAVLGELDGALAGVDAALAKLPI